MDQKILPFLIILIIVGLFLIYFLLSKKSNNTINKYIYHNKTVVPIGVCEGTRYGCCYDGKTPKLDSSGSNCFPKPKPIGGCAGTRYGCCPDGVTAKHNSSGSNCIISKPIGGCTGTRYGCCPDGVTPKTSAIGKNCFETFLNNDKNSNFNVNDGNCSSNVQLDGFDYDENQYMTV